MKIVGISGRKQAGKNTAANIMHGMVLEKYGMVENWAINEAGALKVLTRNGAGVLAWGEADVSRKDQEFAEYAEENLWPYVKLYSFADQLKWISTELFNIPHECVWGTNEQKEQEIPHLRWENMPGVIVYGSEAEYDELYGNLDAWGQADRFVWRKQSKKGMTAREFMQFLGTEIGRKMYEPIWIEATMKKIQREQSELAIIADCRFPNEAKAIEDAGGYVVRLTRQPFTEDVHPSETAMDDFPFKYCIDNEDTELTEFIVNTREFYNNFLA